ncbi:MAG: tetratricopeptide repeat protein [Candidatus Sumerlaeaceae bacterium]
MINKTDGHRSKVLCLAALAVMSTRLASAHPELIQQIDALTTEIVQQPTSGVLYLRRGELHRLHRDWPSAQMDYEKASSTGADPAGVRLARGRMLTDAGELDRARSELDALASEHPDLSAVHLARAQLLQLTTDSLESVDAWTSAIETASEPRPEWYLSRAALLFEAGSTRVSAAIQGLEEGIARLGPVISLQLKAVELEERAGLTTAAAARLEKIAQDAPRRESYLVQLAELYAHAAEHTSAALHAAQADRAIAALPARLQSTSATMALRHRLLSLQTNAMQKSK